MKTVLACDTKKLMKKKADMVKYTKLSAFQDELTKISGKLSSKARDSLSEGAFVFPGERRYPIHDAAHARNALARASGKSEEGKVRAAVRAKFPNIGKD